VRDISCLDALTVMRLMNGVITAGHTFIHIIKHQIQNKLDTLRSVIVIPDARQFMCISANSSEGFLVIHVKTGGDVHVSRASIDVLTVMRLG